MMLHKLTKEEWLWAETLAAANSIWAYLQESESVQKVIREMVSILMDESSDKQEQEMAIETLQEVFNGSQEHTDGS